MKQLQFKFSDDRKRTQVSYYKQLTLQFTEKRGRNTKPPRRIETRGRPPYWAAWCGWCRKDHTYHRTNMTQEQVHAMHQDHIENICRLVARGEDPFS